jgi:hypothetical protein
MGSEGDQEDGQEEKLDRAELLGLHQHYATEMRACLDLAHRNLAFYVGLLSAILAAVLAGLLQLDGGDAKALGLLIGPALIVWLAEVGYSTVRVFYHRFMDAYLTLLNIQRMLRLDDSSWVSADVAPPCVPSAYGGFVAQWTGALDWLKDHPQLDMETAKQTILSQQPSTPLDILRSPVTRASRLRAATLRDARATMWAFELGGLMLVPAIIVTGL